MVFILVLFLRFYSFFYLRDRLGFGGEDLLLRGRCLGFRGFRKIFFRNRVFYF